MNSVLVCGGVTRDVNLLTLSQLEKPGGGVLYAGSVYANQDADVTLCYAGTTALGEEIAGRVRARHLQQLSPTDTCFINDYRGEERRQEIKGLADTLLLPAELPAFDLIHLCPLHHRDLDARWFALDKKGTRRLALDIQGLLRPSQAGVVKQEAIADIDLLMAGCTDIKASRDEFNFLLAHLSLEESRLLTRFSGTRFVVTDGGAGGVCLKAGEPPVWWRAPSLPDTVDTTGAGDTFFAFYLSACRPEASGPALARHLDEAAAETCEQLIHLSTS